VLFLASGAGKADMLHAVINGPFQPEQLPSQIVRPTDGRLTWLVDEVAAAKLRENS
jgi:6-phosphogluconolactonase